MCKWKRKSSYISHRVHRSSITILYLPPQVEYSTLNIWIHAGSAGGKFVGQLDSDPYRSVVDLSTGSVSCDVVGSFIVTQAISQDYEKCGRPDKVKTDF